MRNYLQKGENCLQKYNLAGIANSSIPGFLQDCPRQETSRGACSKKFSEYWGVTSLVTLSKLGEHIHHGENAPLQPVQLLMQCY